MGINCIGENSKTSAAAAAADKMITWPQQIRLMSDNKLANCCWAPQISAAIMIAKS